MASKKQVGLILLLLGVLYKLYLEYKKSSKRKNKNNNISNKISTNFNNNQNLKFALAFHGGAGVIERDHVNTKDYYKSLEVILKKAYQLCLAGERNNLSAVDIACTVVMLLENNPFFNAGKGSVYTRKETHELAASVMDGKTLDSGCVGLLKTIKNPILLAKDVMYNTPHIMLFGAGAELFAQNKLNDFSPKYKHEIVKNNYYDTKKRMKQLEEDRKEEEKNQLNKNSTGTVGCVVMFNGNVAAATSTGGRSNKMLGRIGDTPCIGCGTYASNKTGAFSGTGIGEYFIQNVSCYDLHNRMLYNNNNIKECMDNHINDYFPDKTGGFIGVDKYGNIGISMNTPGMFRGYLQSNNIIGKISIWEEEIDVRMD